MYIQLYKILHFTFACKNFCTTIRIYEFAKKNSLSHILGLSSIQINCFAYFLDFHANFYAYF